jgi:hypothetical protein
MTTFLERLQKHPSYKKAMAAAPNNVGISSRISNFHPCAFWIGTVIGEATKYDHWMIINPNKLSRKEIKKVCVMAAYMVKDTAKKARG